MSVGRRLGRAAQIVGALANVVGGLFLGFAVVLVASFSGDSPSAGVTPYVVLGVGLIIPLALVYFGARALFVLFRTRGAKG
jgi:hypothetical protein